MIHGKKIDIASITVDLKSEQCQLMNGNIAMVEAALISGCRYFFGYPITPQNDVPAHFALRMPQIGGHFVQAESEVAAINMVYGAAAAGGRVMTSSSSPGISLKQEGISYLASAQLPCVIANMQRGGPGLGNILAAQSDYFQSVKGGGHGDYQLIVLAPSTVQELANLTVEAFELADIWRNPVMILGDAMLAQVTEPVILPGYTPKEIERDYALTGCAGRLPRVVRTLWLVPDDAVEKHNIELQEKYKKMSAELPCWEEYRVDDAEIVLVAYGSMARIVRSAVDEARSDGKKYGMVRPVMLNPFCYDILRDIAERPATRAFLAVEMSYGQMVEDVRLGVEGRKPVHFFGKSGGAIPAEKEILYMASSLRGIP